MSNELRQIRDVACPRCACVCDDLTITLDRGQLMQVTNDCSLSRDWFRAQGAMQAPGAPVIPAALVNGAACEWQPAAQRAAGLLRGAKATLIFGLSQSSTDGQRAAVALADELGATIDTSASQGHAPSILAVQQVGESTCSLGEVKERCDLVLYWGANPMQTHPRHWSRYAVEPKSELLPRGRLDRRVVVIDVKPTATSQQADQTVLVEQEQDLPLIWALRAVLRGIALDQPAYAGVSRAAVEQLALQMKQCRSGVIFFGYGVAQQHQGHRVVEALLQLVTDLNQFTRFYARRMRIVGDVSGADSVLCWQTGFPFSVNFSAGYPRYSPGEFSASGLLERGEVDTVVVVGTELLHSLPPRAKERLTELPTVFLAHPGAKCDMEPTVQIHTAIHGVHRAGTAYRMDEMPIRLRPWLDGPWPSDAEVLTEIHQQCRQ